MNRYDILIEILSEIDDLEAKSEILKSFIEQHGPIPSIYEDIVRMIMEGKNEQ